MLNNKNITLFNYVYSSTYERDKSDDLKWEEFGKLCISKMNCAPYDFVLENDSLLNINKSAMWQDICGNKGIDGKFVILNFIGEKEYLNYKVRELESIISNYGTVAFKNLETVFDSMCNESIREILIECRNRNLIEFNNNIFIYASNRLYNILYDNIKVIVAKNENNLDRNNIIINNGEMIYQLGNGNVTNIGISDDKLFELLENKLETLRMEIRDYNCDDKLLNLEKAVKKRDKKSILSILSELASIGSFIASTVLKMYGIDI